jgi:hypothetical protein
MYHNNIYHYMTRVGILPVTDSNSRQETEALMKEYGGLVLNFLFMYYIFLDEPVLFSCSVISYIMTALLNKKVSVLYMFSQLLV